MIALTTEVLAAGRKKLFGRKPVFERHAPASEAELAALESDLQCKLPSDLRYWLATAGFGDIDQTLSIRSDWFNRFDGTLPMQLVTFARDELSDIYAFDISSGSIYFVSVHESYYAKLADSFHDFLAELARRDYKIIDWSSGPGLHCTEYGA